jgi:hypothetical protein
MFAGHAGTDVAIYSSKNLFQSLRNNDSYKAGQIEKVVVVVVLVYIMFMKHSTYPLLRVLRFLFSGSS